MSLQGDVLPHAPRFQAALRRRGTERGLGLPDLIWVAFALGFLTSHLSLCM